MSDLTLDEQTNAAAHRAKTDAADKFFYNANEPFFPLGFSVYYRNPGHWDVSANKHPGEELAHEHVNGPGTISPNKPGRERAFRIRGEPGNVVVLDERWNPHNPHPRPQHTFRSVMAAMLWIAEELMQEPHP